MDNFFNVSSVIEKHLGVISEYFTSYLKETKHLRIFFSSDEKIRELRNYQFEFFKDSLRFHNDKLKIEYSNLGKLNRKKGVPLLDFYEGFLVIKRSLFTTLSTLKELNEHYQNIEAFFDLIKKSIAMGYVDEEVLSFEQDLKKSLANNIFYRSHIKWVLDFLGYIKTKNKKDLPVMEYEKSNFKEWFGMSQITLVIKTKEDRESISNQHKKMFIIAKSIIHFIENENYYQSVLLLDTLSSTSLKIVNILNQGIINNSKNMEDTFFQFVILDSKVCEKMSHLSIVNISKLGLINKYRGVDIGDLVLDEVERALKSFLVGLSEDIVYIRSTRGEFYIYFPELFPIEIQQGQLFLKQFLENLVINVGDSEFGIKISIGTIGINKYVTEKAVEKLLHYTLALAKDKSEKNYFLSAIEEKIAVDFIDKGEKNIELVQEALLKSALEIFFQPVIDLQSGELYDVEALARIKRDGVYLHAGAFIDLIYELDIIVELDVQILHKLIEYSEKLKKVTNIVFVNVSPSSLRSYKYIQELEISLSELSKNGIKTCFELTEQSFLDNLDTIKELSNKYNIKFAVDDFGTGYSSLKSVADLAEHGVIEFIKIDGSIVQNILDSENTYQILDATSYMSKKLKLKNIAEFIETQEVLDKVKSLGIQYGQGYFFSKPLDIDALLEKYSK